MLTHLSMIFSCSVLIVMLHSYSFASVSYLLIWCNIFPHDCYVSFWLKVLQEEHELRKQLEAKLEQVEAQAQAHVAVQKSLYGSEEEHLTKELQTETEAAMRYKAEYEAEFVINASLKTQIGAEAYFSMSVLI